MKNDYTGMYLGLVVQNNDPEKRGRIKVYVPHISTTLYDSWNKDASNKNFIFPDSETNPDLTNIISTLKDVLPWAECASPLFGGCASGRYNAYFQKGSTSDSNYWEDGAPVEGNRPIQNYIGDNVYPDVFTGTNNVGNKFTNPYAYQYTPSNYSNLARGLFTIPNVGAHVWVFFVEGNTNMPVYFAVSYGQEDWKRIYSMAQTTEDIDSFVSTDYPGSYENKTASEVDSTSDVQTFRAKTVFNSNKHSIELVDTDNREILKLTHFSGSFKEFNNFANIELATNNDQKMVLGDQFLTVKKNQSIYVGMSQEVIVAGDQYLTVGSADRQDVKDLVDKLKQIHEYKKLFDIQRAEAGVSPNMVSQYQTKNGTYTVCPVCSGIPYVIGSLDSAAWSCQELFIYPSFIPYPEITDMGNVAALVGQTGVIGGAYCDVCNPGGQGIDGTTGYMAGYSPSTQNGTWVTEPLKATGGTLDLLVQNNATKIADLERKLGEGDQITTIIKNKIETIGLVMNDMLSFRVDPVGKLRTDGAYVALEGIYSTYKTSPHVEYVDVDDVPGGDYNLTVMNKYKLLVGAKGINIKTFGPIDIYGTIVNMTGEQVNISSMNEVLIDGGERFSIRARKISLHPYEHNPVAIDGQLHVTRNMIVAGGTYMEGEVGLLHMTTPYEWKLTEQGSAIQTYTALNHVHGLPPHQHWYKSIPVTFLPSTAGVRDTMRSLGINSTTQLVESTFSITDIESLFGDRETFEELVGSVADDAVSNLDYVSPGEYGRVSDLPDITGINTAGENTYTMTYYYNYKDCNGNQRDNGIKVEMTVDVSDPLNIEVSEPVITMLSGPTDGCD